MYFKALLVFLFAFTVSSYSQISCSPEDSTLFYSKLKAIKKIKAGSYGDSLVAIGKSFLKTPYHEKTLEIGKTETLVVNLRGFDCTTFVENVLAFGSVLKKGHSKFIDFVEQLKNIRYRDGILDGYPSRLHYFSEWITNNEKKGLVKNITPELGGEQVRKAINFMGTHRNLYPFLAYDDNFEAIQNVETELAKESLCILPQEQIENNEHLIQSGDIVALATSIKGLDVTHTGIAVRLSSGRIHLLHASISGSVRITEEPLTDYLKKIKSNNGIIVARPL